MFLDEARLVARLNHPSIVQVFDIGDDEGGVFFAMEYVKGHDLSDILSTCFKQKRRLSIAEALAIAIPIAEGLHHAHELCDDQGQPVNLVHRDVTPSNVIVTSEGRVKLLDFGVAKSKAHTRNSTGVSLKGKFGYMAPEQCEGLELDRRCDVFSFGVLLWELLTGRRLYPGGNNPTVLLHIMSEDARPPSRVRPEIPTELDEICRRALSRDREGRYPSMQELLLDIDRFTTSSSLVMSSRTLSALLADVFGVEDDLAFEETPIHQCLQGPDQPEFHERTSARGRSIWVGAALATLVIGALAAVYFQFFLHRSAVPAPPLPAPAAVSEPKQPVAEPAEPEPLPEPAVVDEAVLTVADAGLTPIKPVSAEPTAEEATDPEPSDAATEPPPKAKRTKRKGKAERRKAAKAKVKVEDKAKEKPKVEKKPWDSDSPFLRN